MKKFGKYFLYSVRHNILSLNPFTSRVSYGDIKVILTYESVNEIL